VLKSRGAACPCKKPLERNRPMKQLTLCRAAAAALCLLLLAGCGAASSGPASSAGGASAAATAPADSGAACTFTDDLGREVTLEAAPRRVAALTGSYADIWCTAGGRDTSRPRSSVK